ncbi:MULTISPECIES: UV DNA damage repair endonuclease UvsE [Rossellomorea]|jgi:UV DNA damage endonuclease|uniref:UV DNA damage repair endonuclease UvsE n=1 Tax=Rossellomorea TaxID=2837508 RepID=UPI0011E8D9FE|nr:MULTISPECIES: UV DNA damage repair endonuclease UvsE [Rossellomorea]MDT9026706.1 UV DNA damage repair endonuclease UvsE [Rossellomorea sp. YC4-1]TYS85139.1 UV DNA damage repair endonuclease UvsE [Rossellomorea aquimaris]
MKVRLGFVANSLSLWDASPAKTMTFKRYSDLPKEERMDRLKEVTRLNLEHTKRILYLCAAHEIELYRLSSSLVPLATHPDVEWDFYSPFKDEWKELGDLIKRFGIRASFHPNQFTLFTSPKQHVTDNAVKDMVYHYRMLEYMGIEDSSVINIHIGGSYGDKAETLVRFHENLKSLPTDVKKIMTLENDDKTYTVEETLGVCQRENIPMVLDIHHHEANLSEKPLEDYLEAIFATWEKRDLVPKIHISSPKSDKAFRSHADLVDAGFVEGFFKTLKTFDQDIDFMIEAKHKDLAMLKLIEDLSTIRGVKRISGGALEW